MPLDVAWRMNNRSEFAFLDYYREVSLYGEDVDSLFAKVYFFQYSVSKDVTY